jgi:ABC-type uncharacterized transport system fused permease/ATPase subunit
MDSPKQNTVRDACRIAKPYWISEEKRSAWGLLVAVVALNLGNVYISVRSAGTWLTIKIGRPLVPRNFRQQRFEADFRFSLVRLRENAESVALYRGETMELGSFQEEWANSFYTPASLSADGHGRCGAALPRGEIITALQQKG